MKIKLKSGNIFDTDKHIALQNLTEDDINELLEMFEKGRLVEK